MEPNNLMLSQDAFNAYMLRGVMGANGQPGEPAQDAQTRWAAIVEIFRTFEAANPMEAMIACHCISLRFMLDAAMRDAGAPDLDPAMAIRLRASVLAVGKSLHLWMTEFASLDARNEARAWARFQIVCGFPDPEREVWVLAGFDPCNDQEQQRLDDLQKALGFSPVHRASQLRDKARGAPRNIKRVLQELIGDDLEREAQCWTAPPLETLRQRGIDTGLTAFLAELDTALRRILKQSQ